MKKLLLTTVSAGVLFTSGLVSGPQAEAASPKKLDEKSKIALAYFTSQSSKSSFSRKEIISGNYVSYYYPTGISKKYSKTFDLYRMDNQFEGAPKNMKFYGTKIPKSNYISVIGVSDSTIVVSGTQSYISYKELVSYGKKYNMKNYLKYRNSKDFKKIVSKIRIVKY